MKEDQAVQEETLPVRPVSDDGAPAGEDPSEELLIRPKKGWQAIDFGELRRYRELLYFLTWRDIKVRYKQTVLGAAWAVLQPIITMIIFSVIFGRLAKIPSDGAPYPIFVYAGLLPWTFFSSAVSRSGGSLVSSANLLTKVYFPRLLVPTGSVMAVLVDFALSFLVYIVIMVWYQHLPGPMVALLPALLLLTFMTALGAGFVLTSLTVSYRDFRIVIPFLLQIWMFASPVVYPASLLPEQYRWILALNPLTGIIGGFRSALLNQPMDWQALGISVIVATVIFVFGIYNFRRTERRFADIV